MSRSNYNEIPIILVSDTISQADAVKLIVDHGISESILKANLSRLNSAIVQELNDIKLNFNDVKFQPE